MTVTVTNLVVNFRLIAWLDSNVQVEFQYKLCPRATINEIILAGMKISGGYIDRKILNIKKSTTVLATPIIINLENEVMNLFLTNKTLTAKFNSRKPANGSAKK